MIHLYLWALLWIWDTISHPPARVVNEAKIAAEQAFEAGEYLEAAISYKQVVDASIFSDPAGRLNMANAYFLAGSEELAYQNYKILSRIDDPLLAAKAKFQLGMIALGKQDTIEALNQLREAILLDRRNEAIIADFEILRTRFSGNPDQQGVASGRKAQPDSVVKSVENDQIAETIDNAVVELSDQRDQLLQNLDKINMSEEQARAILDAMKVNERQYIYQLRRLGARGGGKTADKVEW